MRQQPRSPVAALLALCFAASCAPQAAPGAAPGGDGTKRAAPVEVAEIRVGPLTERRVFTGTLEASAEVVVAPRVAGNVERLSVDIGDPVENGQVIAWIDDDELVQAVAQAEADLAVGKASLEEAEASARLATRVLARQAQLQEDGIASSAELESAEAADAAGRAMVAVAEARVVRSEAALETARVRLGQTRIVAEWEPAAAAPGGQGAGDGAGSTEGPTRFIAERFVDVGSIVNSSTPLVSLVALDPIVAVVFVPERDFSRLAVDQRATFTTDAYPGQSFSGRVARIAPVFRRSTRQVRVELEVRNTDRRLRPGMFVRATLELDHAEEATVVPVDALITREGIEGVFVLPSGARTVRWAPVRRGLNEGGLVQVLGDGLSGAVVTLGQELCDDGSEVSVFIAGSEPGAEQ
jgi:multidrug efflux pump subunit AcrA (membrane-fusion protein)